jgi:hypothetical protein
MSSMMSLSIPVEKLRGIEQSEDKNGRKYFNFTIAVNDEADKYGNNVSCWVKQSKEDVAAKTAKTYIGNGKVFWGHGANAPAKDAVPAQSKAPIENDLPF